jgi:predicted ATP-grasp superfamily ATP-dependent carboligase
MKVLILDGHLKGALCAVRSLGEKGIFCTVLAERSTAMACHSRFRKRSGTYPSPLSDEEGFIRAIKKSIPTGEKSLIISCSDATTTALLRNKKHIEEYATLLLPPPEIMAIATDKIATYGKAYELGVPTIPTHLLEKEEDIARIMETMSYPAVVKPRASILWRVEGKGVFGTAQFIHSSRELKDAIKKEKEKTGEWPMVQPCIFGEEYGVELVADRGAIRGVCVHKRLRSLSPSGGAAVLKETIDSTSEIGGELLAYTEKIVRALSWHGPLMAEFKVEKGGKIFLMELNPRLWGSLPLSVAAGFDVPYLMYRLALGEDLSQEKVVARAGVITRHFLGDVRNLLRVLFLRDAMRSRTYPLRLAAFKNFLLPPSGTQSDIFRMSDPLPSFFEYYDVFRSIV